MRQLKKYFIVTALIALPSLFVHAQHVSGGFKGGLTMSNLYIDKNEVDDENARFGFHAGLFSQIMLSEHFGIQPEILFTTKGTEATYDGLINQTVDFRMNYLDLPVMAVVRPIELLEIYAGPYVGLLINTNVKYSGTFEGEETLDRDNFNTLDYGFTGGMALNFGSVTTGIRYSLGLQKLANSNRSEILLGDSKNAYGQLYIAFRLSE